MTDVILAGLAAFYVWSALNLLPFLARLRTLPGYGCPWCLGAWLALAATLAVDHDHLGVGTLVSWFASAAIVGMLGVIVPDDGEPT